MTEDALMALQPPFVQWTGRRAVRAVAAATEAGRSLFGVAADALSERARVRQLYDATADQWQRISESERPAVMSAALAELEGGPLGRRTERAVEGGRCGLDALADRVAREASRRAREAAVAFQARVALMETEAGISEGTDRGVELMATRLASDPEWRLARVGLGVLTKRALSGRSIAAGALRQARRLASDPLAPVWTQVAAIDLVAAADGRGAWPALAARLTMAPPAAAADDLFVRPHAARALARVDPAAAASVLRRSAAHDPSEHVRMELAGLLAELGQLEALRDRCDPAKESSPRVRAAAAAAAISLDPHVAIPVLLDDPSEIPRRIALEEAEALAPQHPALRAAIEEVVAGGGKLARLAAEAAERLHHRIDGTARATLEGVQAQLSAVAEGARQTLDVEMSPLDLGRALARVATDDFGIEARRTARGYAAYRGDRMGRRLWRALYEMRHPAPEKRQGHLHTIGRAHPGTLRAPPGRLAEVTATRVPGERLVMPESDDWGRHLPTVDDLLDRPPSGETHVFSAFGVTRVGYPRGAAGWLRARAKLTFAYARYAALRNSALGAIERRDRAAYVRALAALGFTLTFFPHRPAPPEVAHVFTIDPPSSGTEGRLLSSAAVGALAAGDLIRRILDPAASSPAHLAALTLAGLGLFTVRLFESRRHIEQARAAIPLTIGGWGTRGKSGTERLKTALFQGLGCEVMVKTTGCEALIIHATPDVRAEEIFIYRPYDKATIWEQRELLELAARLEVDVFLWECMALQPSYVDILQQHWMRDPICTLTNAHPDHENIQGPAGHDVARAMVSFIPRGGHLLTAEENMLPILRAAAGERGATLHEVRYRDEALLPEDIRARFPYEEHPRNIALVVSLAAALGVPRDMALKEMADWVVPDLGVLKTYPAARWRGRLLEFSNGMSANERTGFLNNWQRLGFPGAGVQPGEWVVTVVNNRADRVSRSEVFADVVVNDAAAHAHVLIGTNLSGLLGYIDRALASTLRSIVLFHPDEAELPADRAAELARERVSRACARLKLTAMGSVRLVAEAEAMARGLGAEAQVIRAPFDRAIEACAARACRSLVEARGVVTAILPAGLESFLAAFDPETGQEILAALTEVTARHALLLAWNQRLDSACGSKEGRSNSQLELREIFAELFRAGLVVLEDAGMTGDQVIDAIARACPPGFRVRMMGIQNIKGTGLDFAYRWLSHERTVRLISRLEGASDDEAMAIGRALAADPDTGILDGPAAVTALTAAARCHALAASQQLMQCAESILARHRQKEGALGTGSREKGKSGGRNGQAPWEILAGVRRRARADQLLAELAAGRLSHRRAAEELRALMKTAHG